MRTTEGGRRDRDDGDALEGSTRQMALRGALGLSGLVQRWWNH